MIFKAKFHLKLVTVVTKNPTLSGGLFIHPTAVYVFMVWATLMCASQASHNQCNPLGPLLKIM